MHYVMKRWKMVQESKKNVRKKLEKSTSKHEMLHFIKWSPLEDTIFVPFNFFSFFFVLF